MKRKKILFILLTILLSNVSNFVTAKSMDFQPNKPLGNLNTQRKIELTKQKIDESNEPNQLCSITIDLLKLMIEILKNIKDKESAQVAAASIVNVYELDELLGKKLSVYPGALQNLIKNKDELEKLREETEKLIDHLENKNFYGSHKLKSIMQTEPEEVEYD